MQTGVTSDGVASEGGSMHVPLFINNNTNIETVFDITEVRHKM